MTSIQEKGGLIRRGASKRGAGESLETRPKEKKKTLYWVRVKVRVGRCQGAQCRVPRRRLPGLGYLALLFVCSLSGRRQVLPR